MGEQVDSHPIRITPQIHFPVTCVKLRCGIWVSNTEVCSLHFDHLVTLTGCLRAGTFQLQRELWLLAMWAPKCMAPENFPEPIRVRIVTGYDSSARECYEWGRQDTSMTLLSVGRSHCKPCGYLSLRVCVYLWNTGFLCSVVQHLEQCVLHNLLCKDEAFRWARTHSEWLFDTSEGNVYNFVQSSAEQKRAGFSSVHAADQS